MNLFDFIGLAFYLLGAWVSQYWLWLAALCILLCLIGWQLSAKNVQPEEAAPDTLSREQKDALDAWVMRQKMPPSAPEMVALAQEYLASCREECTEERFDNPSFD